jgi:hypothetical protein
MSQKKEAFFRSYAKKMCDDAIEEKRIADREAMLAQQTPVSTPNYSSISNCLSKVLLPGMPCPLDFFTSTFEKYDILGFSSMSTVSMPPTHNLGRLGLNKYSPSLSDITYDANSIDLYGATSESSRYDLGFKSTSMAIAPTSVSGSASVSNDTVGETATAPVENSFLQSASQMAAQLNAGTPTNQMAVVPSWTMPIPDASTASRGLASVPEDEEESGTGDRRRGASERSIQEIEARQTLVEQQVLAQAKEAQTIQDLKNQAQIEQLRIELQKLQLSNKQLMTNIQKLSAPRKTQSEDNIFDQDFDEEEEGTFEVSEPAPSRPVSRGVAQTNLVKAEGTTTAVRSGIDSSTVSA